LTEQHRAVLAVESQFWRHAGAEEDAIRERTVLTPNRYYQVLNSLVDRTDAWEYAPQALARVARLRDRTRTRRSA
jgi:trans-aconitate methyltransferase